MSEPLDKRPPLMAAQWLDFIIGSAAHRSQNAGQQKFGELLIERYYRTLPERYKDDPTATRYFDEILCTVSAAVRGFSVVRDVFQTNWDTLKAARDLSQKQAERLDQFSPLKKDGYLGQIVVAVIGLGLGAPLSQAVKAKWEHSTLVSLLVVAASVAVSLLLVEATVEWLRGRQAQRIERRFPAELLDYWEDRALGGYRKVLLQFLPLAREITNRHYPGTYSSAPDSGEDAAEIERHFAFKLRKSANTGLKTEKDRPPDAEALSS